jgi:Dolichyl-phosphate-mannose-protein mannosyltransferase
MQHEMANSRRQWGIWLLVLCLMALAVLFRLADLSARNLWTDEAWVALAVLQPTPAQVLATGRSTPPFYLLSVWAVARVFGHSEAILRSLSFFFGLGTVLLFWPLARTLTTRAAAIMGLTALVFSPIMVYFSKELKQYSGDAFFAVLILVLTERLQTSQRWSGWLLLAFAGMLGLGFSHSLIFILPVSLATLWFALPAHRRRVALMALVWSGTFAALYFLFIRHQMDPELVEYWSRDFPDFSSLTAFLVWLGGAWRRYLEYFLGPNGLFWGAPLLVLGVFHLLRHHQRLACFYLAGPLLLAFGASALHRYPFMANYGGSRLMLFSAPLLYLIVATGGVVAVLFLWRHRLRWLAPFLIGGIFFALEPVPMMQENFHTSFNLSQIEPLVQHLKAKTRPGDKVYVYYYAIYPFKYYYQGNLDLVYWGRSCVETGLDLGGDDEDDNDDNGDNGREPRRLWLIAGHYPNKAYMEAFAVNLLGPRWQQMNCLTAPCAVLYRFERRGAAVAKNPADPPKSAVSGPPAPAPEKAYK